MPDLRSLIADGRAHVFDGAMGTMLYQKGVFINVCYDELNLRAPDVVREVHAAYVKAGAELIETNTFGANPVKLAQYGLADQTFAINQRAAEIAREAAGDRAAVLGAIGPLGVRLEPFGEMGARRGVRLLQGPGRGARRGRRPRVHPRDVLRPRRDPRGAAGRARGERPAGDRPDDGGRGRQHRLRHRRRDLGPRARRGRAPTSSASTARSARRACSRRSSGWRA